MPLESQQTPLSEFFEQASERMNLLETAIKQNTSRVQQLEAAIGQKALYTKAEVEVAKRETDLEKIRQEIKMLFNGARGQRFFDGMESAFSRDLISIIKEHGDAAVKVIVELVFADGVSAEVMGEALRWMGDIDHPQSQKSRLELLKQSLKSPAIHVRDGAILGLAFMDDTHAIPALRQAIRQEEVAGLREDMKQVLEQLEETGATNT